MFKCNIIIYYGTMEYKRLNIRLPRDTNEKLEKLCSKEKRSKSNMITWVLDIYYNEFYEQR